MRTMDDNVTATEDRFPVRLDGLGSIGRQSDTAGRKGRVALACKRCKRRKQRCDGSHPTCGKTLYINALEERIAFLEARLPDHAQDHFETLAPSSVVDGQDEAVNTQTYPESSSSHRGSVSEDLDGYERNSIIDGVAYLSLCASGTAEATPDPSYLGSSSGAAIARMIQRSIFHNSRNGITRPSNFPRQPNPSVDPYLESLAPSLHLHPDEPSHGFPFPDEARHLFDIFFDRMHTRWPILDRKKYTELFELQYQQGALSITQRSIMHLIYAITARFEQLTRKPSQVDPEKHLLAAIEPMDYILEQHNLATVQFLLLLAVHGQRSPYGAGAWSQVRYAVSLCIELGLHRERQGPPPSSDIARDLEIRRRAFWSCYCLDRGTSVVLGRAFAISDRDINVSMPNPGREYWDLTHALSPGDDHAVEWCNIEPFIHIIKLEKIQSRIHRTVFRVDKDIFSGPVDERVKLDQKMASIRSDLDRWIQTTPQSPKDNGKITWLYDPESTNQDAGDFYSLTLTYTMISLHSCFVAGLTLMYCIWKDKSLFSYHVVEATQACSQSLTVFGEKWSGAVKYRDIFDALSGSLLKTLMSPGGLSGDTGMGVHPTPPLQTKFDRPSFSASPGSSSHQPSSTLQNSNEADDITMRDLVSDAVKEAFMEVDEEAPGGWHGWHMWNEMLGENPSASDLPTFNVFSGAAKGCKDVWNLSQGDLDLSRGWDFSGQ
ncbi:STB5-SIN3 binding protein [Fusarium napiforme]|uniref:STB5-SIN3 binding protein n=1 Tax=Fusarium napiforme TaxID=42672 RepID=A0A8H5MM90_9HYPO|nr:STB5-SIN3 binding protein [Fusarium napiforme]